ncbi:MAG TPA: DUF4398 domain-containing protein [Burkholderiales bacterium]|jgi:hypothetical protein
MPYVICKACTDRSDLQPIAAALGAALRPGALWLALGRGLLAFGLGGCASMPQPVEQIDAARAAVSKAEPVVAQDGSMELRVAQYKLARAEQEAQRGEYTNARIYAEQAQVDADYARAIADNARVERDLADANQSVRRMQDELDRRAK